MFLKSLALRLYDRCLHAHVHYIVHIGQEMKIIEVLANKWIKIPMNRKYQFYHSTEYYSVHEKWEMLSFTTTLTSLEDILLSKINHAQKTYDLIFMCNAKKVVLREDLNKRRVKIYITKIPKAGEVWIDVEHELMSHKIQSFTHTGGLSGKCIYYLITMLIVMYISNKRIF